MRRLLRLWPLVGSARPGTPTSQPPPDSSADAFPRPSKDCPDQFNHVQERPEWRNKYLHQALRRDRKIARSPWDKHVLHVVPLLPAVTSPTLAPGNFLAKWGRGTISESEKSGDLLLWRARPEGPMSRMEAPEFYGKSTQ